ncbi:MULTISPECIES: kynureninase [Brevibacterium]|uniref:Kynureninase n=2 Tax=Brevibacterium casei TaxID=33889 RepID=K9AQP7_9MICO|nr:kynureninase [Brevibacterium casei]NJE67687.1 kynureninase [Brevibacterium sp. LS14]SIH78463.1 aminotransferase [Mycobacteroides abscessus subsp. abscessus]EKU48336.1 kynureninase [Brevibacterium casei S18]KZE21498.1 kynureninase [Brevibacterium casei]MBE4696105.1 kynureninase [Brevibacterium casei]
MTELTVLDRAACQRRDADDPLRGFRDDFIIPTDTIYLDGNSLGARPKGAAERAAAVIEDEWGEGLIRSWNTAGWFELPAALGEKVSGLVGGGDGSTVVTDTTSINLFKAASAALRIQAEDRPERRVILTQRENFPSDIYMLQGLAEQLDDGYEVRLVDDAEVTAGFPTTMTDEVALVVLTHVNYRTGRLFDMRSTTEAIHAGGALAIWDLCHSAGALPIDLAGGGADMAVGCTYKFLNGGPGSPAFIWVAEEHRNRFAQPLSGWWSHAKPFEMSPGYAPAEGIRRFLTGTQGIVSMSVAEVGLDVAARADMGAVRAKSLELSDLFIELVETRLSHHPVEIVTPREHEHRGSQVSIAHEEGFAIMSALIARGIIGDYREPSILRFGLTPLYLGFADVWDTVEALRDILDNRLWDTPEFKVRGAVT